MVKPKRKRMSKVFTIAEVGINRNGSMDITKQPIDVAVQAGCDIWCTGHEVGLSVLYAASTLGSE